MGLGCAGERIWRVAIHPHVCETYVDGFGQDLVFEIVQVLLCADVKTAVF
jgi:hypothetical protein